MFKPNDKVKLYPVEKIKEMCPQASETLVEFYENKTLHIRQLNDEEHNYQGKRTYQLTEDGNDKYGWPEDWFYKVNTQLEFDFNEFV